MAQTSDDELGTIDPEIGSDGKAKDMLRTDMVEQNFEEEKRGALVLPEISSSCRSFKSEQQIRLEKQIREKQVARNKEKKQIQLAYSQELQNMKDELTKHEKAAAARQYENIGVALPTVKFSKVSVKSNSSEVVTRESLVDTPQPNKECFICKVRQGGCPLCWDFPKWVLRNNINDEGSVEYVTPLQPRDYAFAPGDDPMVAVVQAGGQRIRPPMHTNLTTHSAIEHYRSLFQTFTRFNVKTVPAGATVSVSLDVNRSCVDELYDAFRSNSAQTERVHLYLPTDAGIFSLCNQDDQETELLRANINAFEKLVTYNVGRNNSGPIKNSTVSILNYPWYSEVEASDAFKRRAKPAFDTVERYIRGCFGREETKPLTSIFYTTKGPLSTLPETTSLPGPDRVQRRLAPVLRGEQTLSEHVEALEEAEDIKKTKAGIEEMETKRKALCLRGGREASIQAAMKAIDDEVDGLDNLYQFKKATVEELQDKLDSVIAEMSALDRVVLTSSKQKVKKPSDLKALKVIQERFDNHDELRLRLEGELRAAIKDAVSTHNLKENVSLKRRPFEDKLLKVRASTALKVPDTAGTRRRMERVIKSTY